MRELGINVIAGPNWDSHVEVICENMSESWCKFANKRRNTEPFPLKFFEWSYQIAVTDRLLQYDPNFSKNQSYDTPLISPGLESIDKVPIHLIVGEKDDKCSLNNAKRIANEIGPAVRSLDIIPDTKHNVVAMNEGHNVPETIL